MLYAHVEGHFEFLAQESIEHRLCLHLEVAYAMTGINFDFRNYRFLFVYFLFAECHTHNKVAAFNRRNLSLSCGIGMAWSTGLRASGLCRSVFVRRQNSESGGFALYVLAAYGGTYGRNAYLTGFFGQIGV